MTLAYNTFVNPTTRMTFGDSAGIPGDLRVIDNIFSETRFQGASGSYAPTNNLLYQTTGGTLGSCPTCITADPLLSGYEIQSGSPAINAASASFTVAEDLEGTIRPQGSGYDIGAYEVTTIPAVPASSPRTIGLLCVLLAAAGIAAMRRRA
jgi:hypothetical protein